MTTPWDDHEKGDGAVRVASYGRHRQRLVDTPAHYVSQWNQRPVLCRLNIHRPLRSELRSPMPGMAMDRYVLCARCGYHDSQWRC